jgi:hypothetical protein
MSTRTNAGQLEGTTHARKVLQAQVSSQAHQSLRDFAETNGISISATVECLAAELVLEPLADSAIDLNRVIGRARAVDAQRRRRSGKEAY